MKNRKHRSALSPSSSKRLSKKSGISRGRHHGSIFLPNVLMTSALFSKFEELVAAGLRKASIRYIGLAEGAFVVIFHGDANKFVRIADQFLAHVEGEHGTSGKALPLTVTYIGDTIDDWLVYYEEHTQLARDRWAAESLYAA